MNTPCKFQGHWKQGRLLNRASKRSNFSPRFEFTSERPHYSLALFSSFICTCTTSKKDKFAFKTTLDYFPKKFPEYANNWLVSRIAVTAEAVTAETVNVTAHRVYYSGCLLQSPLDIRIKQITIVSALFLMKFMLAMFFLHANFKWNTACLEGGCDWQSW